MYMYMYMVVCVSAYSETSSGLQLINMYRFNAGNYVYN